jgi:hypothetical protein
MSYCSSVISAAYLKLSGIINVIYSKASAVSNVAESVNQQDEKYLAVSQKPLNFDSLVSLTLLSHDLAVFLTPLSHCWLAGLTF